MENDLHLITDSLSFDFDIVRKEENYLHIKIPSANVIELLLSAKRNFGLTTLQLISVVDRIEDDLFQLTWILEDSGGTDIFIMSADYCRENCSVPTLGEIWETAIVFERELCEMYGIDFPGNPRQHEDFLLEGWKDIPPLRRDFDTLKYSIQTYGERRERKHINTREYIADATGEWDTPVPMKDKTDE